MNDLLLLIEICYVLEVELIEIDFESDIIAYRSAQGPHSGCASPRKLGLCSPDDAQAPYRGIAGPEGAFPQLIAGDPEGIRAGDIRVRAAGKSRRRRICIELARYLRLIRRIQNRKQILKILEFLMVRNGPIFDSEPI